MSWRLAADLQVGERRAPHVGHRTLPTDDLRDRALQKGGVGAQLGIFAGVLVQGQQAAGDRGGSRPSLPR